MNEIDTTPASIAFTVFPIDSYIIIVQCGFFFLFFVLSFCCFFGPLLWHMEVPRLGVESEL